MPDTKKQPDPKRDEDQPPSTQPDPSVPSKPGVLPDEPPPKPPEKQPAKRTRDHDGWGEHDAAVIKDGPPEPPSSRIRRPTLARGLATHGTHRQVFSAMTTVQIAEK